MEKGIQAALTPFEKATLVERPGAQSSDPWEGEMSCRRWRAQVGKGRFIEKDGRPVSYLFQITLIDNMDQTGHGS
jgi:hypothetical protein